MDELTIERIGGFAGFGLGNSRLKSRGTVSFGHLPDADQHTVRELFSRGHASQESAMRDGFTYRITWRTDKGEQTVEAPESLVPTSLTTAVKDTLE